LKKIKNKKKCLGESNVLFSQFFSDYFFEMFQNPGRYNQGLRNHCIEQTVDIIASATGQLLHEKVFGLFIENATPENFC
jgi:hypothetical protein